MKVANSLEVKVVRISFLNLKNFGGDTSDYGRILLLIPLKVFSHNLLNQSELKWFSSGHPTTLYLIGESIF